MIIEYEGGTYPFEYDDIEIMPAMAIEERMGMQLDDWLKVLGEGGNLRALQCLGWLILKGGDPAVPISETNFKFMKLGEALHAAQVKAAADKAPDPVQPPDPTTVRDSPGPTSQVTAAAAISPDGSSLPA